MGGFGQTGEVGRRMDIPNANHIQHVNIHQNCLAPNKQDARTMSSYQCLLSYFLKETSRTKGIHSNSPAPHRAEMNKRWEKR